jgi:regulatory protein
LKTNFSDSNLNQSERSSVRAAGLRFLARRDFSVAGLREKLVGKFTEDSAEIEKVLAEFQEKNWLSDARFCENMIREKSELIKWGPRKILWKLQEKGIDRAMAENAMQEFFPEKSQVSIAVELATEKQKKIAGKKSDHPSQTKQKILGFLVNRGFDLSIARAAIDFLDFEN